MSQTDKDASDLGVSVRATEYPRDLERVALLANTFHPDSTTVAGLMDSETRRPADERRVRLAAVAPGGLVVAYTDAIHSPWDTPGSFEVELVVDPAWRRSGVGALLWEALRARLAEESATRLEVEIREHDTGADRFAQARGFALVRRRFQSTLDLASFDEARFAGVIERLEAGGARFFSLADVGDTEEARRAVYEINRRAALDIPGRIPTFAPFKEWRRFVCGATWYRAEGQMIVALGETWVGLGAVGYFAETNSLYNMITGVDRAYRGRGLALGLKLRTIALARRYSAAYIRTHNDSENAPMLAINRTLGYQPEPGLLVYVWTA